MVTIHKGNKVYKKYSLKEYEEVKPDIDLKYHLTCESCGAENEINLPFSTNFF